MGTQGKLNELTLMDRLSEMITAYDESLSLDGSRDILGFEVIWSTLGSRIFSSYITTVANDIRNFTLNLFHYSVIHRLLKTQDIHFPAQFQAVIPEPYSIEFKLAIIVLLENIFSLTAAVNSKEGNTGIFDNILGRNAAANIVSKHTDTDIKLILHGDAGFLVRQKQLGVHGRYKAPTLKMGILQEGNLSLKHEDYEQFLSVDPELKSLVEKTAKALSELFPRCEVISDFPDYFRDLKNIKTALPAISYTQAKQIGESIWGSFKDYTKSNQFEKYWLGKLNMSGDTIAGHLYKLVKEHLKAKDKKGGQFNAFILQELRQEPMVKDIILIEPWLSLFLYIFNRLVHSDKKVLSAVADEMDLGQLVQGLSVPTEIFLESENRLFRLRYGKILPLIRRGFEGEYETMVRNLVTYHQEIMKSRQSSPLITITNDGIIHSLYPAGSRMYQGEGFDPTNYQHSYYLDALKHIAEGFSI